MGPRLWLSLPLTRLIHAMIAGQGRVRGEDMSKISREDAASFDFVTHQPPPTLIQAGRYEDSIGIEIFT